MAPSAAAASRARLANELARHRASSPLDNTFETATSTAFQNALHSTPQKPDTATHRLPLHYDQVASPPASSVDSEDLSIEIGRGVKRTAYVRDDSVSSHALFELKDEPTLDMTASPPRNAARRADGSLRKEAALRRATESAKLSREKRTASGAKPRAVSDNLGRTYDRDDIEAPLDLTNTLTLQPRASRCAPTRAVSKQTMPTRFTANQGLTDAPASPARVLSNNLTVQSTTYTANQSFLLPDLPNIAELVSGVRKDGTPVFHRAAKSRSRFTSASYRGPPPVYHPVTSLPLPDDEKAIFASLSLLKDRVSQLEAENSDLRRRNDASERALIDARAQLAVQADGTTADNDDTAASRLRVTRLQVKNKALQDRLERAERKTSVAEITLKRVTNERDALLAQIGSAFFANEELSRENEEFRESFGQIQGEKDELLVQVEELKAANEKLKGKLARAKARRASEAVEEKAAVEETKSKEAAVAGKVRSKKEAALPAVKSGKEKTSSAEDPALDLAARIEAEIARHRASAAENKKASRSRSRSQSRPRSSKSTESRRVSAHVEASEPESTTTLHTRTLPGTIPVDLGDRDVTELSAFETHELADLAHLRRRLEDELRAKRVQQRAPAAPPLTRKSSLKDITVDLDNATRKSVRVQSPRSEDARSHVEYTGSVVSSTPRRRNIMTADAGDGEGETSAFILPDITLHLPSTSLPPSKDDILRATPVDGACISHSAPSCTLCSGPAHVAIPTPVPVSERSPLEDLTTATVRPAQAPDAALATVLKLLQDEITHLKLQREGFNRQYNAHDPALGRRTRVALKEKIGRLTEDVERRAEQVYALFDVLEGIKQTAVEEKMGEVEKDGKVDGQADEVQNEGEEVRETGLFSDEDSDGELPWEGISDEE